MTYTPTRSNTSSWWSIGQPVLESADAESTPSAPSGSGSLLSSDEISQGASGLMYSSVAMTVQISGVTKTTGLYNPTWILVKDTVLGLTWALCPFASADMQTVFGVPPGLPTSCTAYCIKPNAQVVLEAGTIGFTNVLSNLVYTNLVSTTPAVAVAGSGSFVLPDFSNSNGNDNVVDFRNGIYGLIGIV